MQNAATAMNKTEWTLLALALMLVAAVGLRPSIRGNDGVGHYVYLASLLRDGDLDFTNDYARFDALKQYPFVKFSQLKRSPATGRPSNRYGIGASCFWSPFVLAVHGALKLAAPRLADATSRPYEWAVGLGTVFWGSIGLALLYERLRRRIPPLPAAAILLGLLFASPLGFYLYGHGSMSHGVGFFAAVVLLLAFERAWSQPCFTALAWCGFWSAWLVMIRFQDASWVVVLGAALVIRLIALARAPAPEGIAPARAAALLAAFPLAFFAVFWIQMAVWKYLYGAWLSGPMPYLDTTAGSFSRWPVHMLEALFSGRKGVLSWHPLFALGLAGLVLKMRNAECGMRNKISDSADRALAMCGLAGFAFQLWLVASWSMWYGGASFGNRFFISFLPFAALGLARFAEMLTTRRRRVFALALLAMLVLWNLGLLLQYATEMLPREDWVPWSRIIRQNLIEVPKFLFHRIFGR